MARPAGPAPTMRTTVCSSIGNKGATEVLRGDVNVGLEEMVIVVCDELCEVLLREGGYICLTLTRKLHLIE